MNFNDAAFFSDFSAVCTVGGERVSGIFDNGFTDVLGVGASEPSFTTYAASVPGVGYGSTLIINGTVYTVRAVHPDGTGMTTLMLER